MQVDGRPMPAGEGEQNNVPRPLQLAQYPAHCGLGQLRAIAMQGDSTADAVGDKLAAFDALVQTFQTSAGNVSMIGDWDGLTGPIVEAF